MSVREITQVVHTRIIGRKLLDLGRLANEEPQRFGDNVEIAYGINS